MNSRYNIHDFYEIQVAELKEKEPKFLATSERLQVIFAGLVEDVMARTEPPQDPEFDPTKARMKKKSFRTEREEEELMRLKIKKAKEESKLFGHCKHVCCQI